MMKTKILKIAAVVLVFAGSFASCENQEVTQDITLQYQKCECEHEAKYINKIVKENILLLDAEKVTQQDIAEYPDEYVICDFNLKVAFVTKPATIWSYSGDICNFPFDSFGDIPQEGIYISFIGDEYEECVPPFEIPERIYTDIVLTSLKVETK